MQTQSNNDIRRFVLDNYSTFVSDVDPNMLFDHLIQYRIITISEWERIKLREVTPHDQCRALVNHLCLMRNPKTFLVIKEALEKDKHWILGELNRSTSDRNNKRKTPVEPEEKSEQIIVDLLERIDQLLEENSLLEGKNCCLQVQLEEARCKIREMRASGIYETEICTCDSKTGDVRNISCLSDQSSMTSDPSETMQRSCQFTKSVKHGERSVDYKESSAQSKMGCVARDTVNLSPAEARKLWEDAAGKNRKNYPTHVQLAKPILTKDVNMPRRQGKPFGQELGERTGEAAGRGSSQLGKDDDDLANSLIKETLDKAKENAEDNADLLHQLEEGQSMDLKAKIKRFENQSVYPSKYKGETKNKLRIQNTQHTGTTETKTRWGDKDGINYTMKPSLIRTNIKGSASNGQSIYVLTILTDELFITRGGCSEVEVYDWNKFNLKRSWELDGLVDPVDMQSCAVNECLYIIDWKGSGQIREIFRVDPNGVLLNKWEVGYDTGRLSVAHDSNVILTAYWDHRLNEYTPDGKLVREINLSSETRMVNTWHAVKTTGGQYVVSHGHADDSLHRICLVDDEGRIVWSVGAEKGCGPMSVNEPVYLAIDRRGSILVVDRNNSRVLLLRSDLDFKQELLSKKNGIHDPRRICLDETNKRLFVSHINSVTLEAEVLVFKMA